MSEYQYYEFQAVDRPLTPSEMDELRGITSRASITPTRLQNTYHYGDFRGDPLILVEQYFDAFVYVANWGTSQLMLRLPRRLLDLDLARRYVIDEALDVHDRSDAVVIDFTSRDEDGAGWIDDDQAAGWMPALLPLRAELAGGDLRALYVGWLAGLSLGMLPDGEVEPPVPPGLRNLSASLTALVEFLRVDPDLLHVAAVASGRLPTGPSAVELEGWITSLPVADKDDLLIRLVTREGGSIRAEIIQRYQQATAPRLEATDARRTAVELLALAEERAATRRREEEAARAAAAAQRKQAGAAARERRLDSLTGREEELWRRVDALVEVKRAREYDEAVGLLADLRDLSVRARDEAAFAARIRTLRDRCGRRPSFIERLDRAGLNP